MNYRHSFHAGNHADVLKHVALLELLRLATIKDKPLAYLESHAGAGGYALTSNSDAETTGEWRDGIGRLWPALNDAPDAVGQYLRHVAHWNAGCDGLALYPGSPTLAALALRSQDRLAVCETQADAADTLKRSLAGIDRRATVSAADGYHQALKAWLPPPERRGLILIDPPYEAQRAEFDHIVPALAQALTRFASGIYVLWYPIKRERDLVPHLRRIAALPAQSILAVELWVRAADSPLRLNGSGLAVLNPPWPFADQVKHWLPWLARQLAQGRGAGWRSHWLRHESA